MSTVSGLKILNYHSLALAETKSIYPALFCINYLPHCNPFLHIHQLYSTFATL